MSLGNLKMRAGPAPVRLSPERFDALVSAHEAFISGRPGGRRVTLSYIVAKGMRCDGRVLSDARLDGADLSGTTFVGTDLRRSSFYCANLALCDFTEARLQRADLRGCSFSAARLAGANLDEADLRAAVLMASDELLGLRWVGGRETDSEARKRGDLGEGFAHAIDFSNCSMQGVQMRDANLKCANFSGANLNGANMGGARLEGAVFKGAILTGVDVAKLGLPPATFASCVIDPTAEALARADEIRRELERAKAWTNTGGRPANLEGFDLRPAAGDFRERLLAGLQAKSAVAIGVDFTGAQLHAANFEGADLRAANFTRADLQGASFVGANLSHAVFQDAVIGELELRPGLSLPTRFEGAALHGAGLRLE